MLSHLRPPVPSSPVSLSSPLASPLPPSLFSLPLPSPPLPYSSHTPTETTMYTKIPRAQGRGSALISEQALRVQLLFRPNYHFMGQTRMQSLPSPSPPLASPHSSWSIFYNFEFLEFLISNSSNSRFSKPSILQLYTYHDYKHRHRSIILQIQGIRGKL